MSGTVVQAKGGGTGTADAVGAPGTDTYSVTLDAPTAPGNTLLIVVVSNAGIGTDPSGFTLDAHTVFNMGHYLWRKDTGAGGETSWTVTPNVAAAGAWLAVEYEGLVLPSSLDASSTNGTFGGVPNFSTGSTGATTDDVELLVGSWCGVGSGAGTLPSVDNYSNGLVQLDHEETDNAFPLGLWVATAFTSAAGAQESTLTYLSPGAAPSQALLVVYRLNLLVTSEVSHDAAATLLLRAQEAHSAAAVLRATVGATHAAAAHLKATTGVSHGARATLRLPGSVSHGATASLRGTLERSSAAVATLRGTLAVSHGARATLLLAGATVVHSARARLKGTLERSHGARAWLSAPGTEGAVSVALSAPRVLLSDRATGSVQLVVSYDH